jgi:acetate kinase
MKPRGILVINAGSSSIKFTLFGIDAAGGIGDLRYRGMAERVDAMGGHFRASDHADRRLADIHLDAAPGKALDHSTMLSVVLDWLDASAGDIDIVAAGHRVVHGGDQFAQPIPVNAEVITALEKLIPLAPLHQPHNLDAIRALAASRPQLRQVACFDTAFHHSQPEVARRLGVPRELHEAGIKRYGFHGLSYEYIVAALPQFLGEAANGRIVIAHLGNGASMCAIHAGRCVASTMGFSTLDGLLMGTRCGLLDPGVILHLLTEKTMSAAAIADLLYRKSGLLGVSGISADMRILLESAAPQAREAIELFNYRISRELGSLAAALGGLDALVFTGGIGEHAAPVREQVCRAANWLGIELDAAANKANGPLISLQGSPASAWVIPTHEESMIARHVLEVLAD